MAHLKINGARRARLRRAMLRDFGDGVTAPCQLCGTALTMENMTIDRYPIPGIDGGKYLVNNIRPLCLTCNNEDGSQRNAERGRWRYNG